MTTPLTIENPAYFDRLADVETRHWWSVGLWRLASRWLDAALDGRRGLRAFDLGCGTGQTALRLAERAEIGSVVGLDPSPKAIGQSRRRHGLPLVLGSVLELPFRDGSAEVVTCFDVLQHLPAGGDGRALAEVARVLATGGVALVRSNGRGWTGDDSTYRLRDLVRLAERAGLSVERATYANALPALAQEIRGWAVPGRPGHPSGGGLTIRVPAPGLNRVLTGVSSAEAFAAGRLGLRLPFGHSTLVLARKPGATWP